MKKAPTHPLRAARTRYNLTIEQLARETNVGAATIWRAEHGHSINAESRRRLCAYFGITSQELGLAGTVESERKHPAAPSSQEVLDDAPLSSAPSLLRKYTSLEEASTAIPSPSRHAPLQEQTGLWLVLGASQLASTIKEHWTPDTLFEALHIVSQSLQGLPESMRLNLLRQGGASPIHARWRMSVTESVQLQQSFAQSIRQAWQFSHATSPEQVFSVGHALRVLLEHIHTLLPAQVHACFYASIYNLIGSALHHMNDIEAQEQMHASAYVAATEGHDCWNQAQSRNWQAIAANVSGRYIQATQFIEDAIRLIEHEEGEEYMCSKAHLLANWAYNAALLQDYAIVREKLEESRRLLEGLSPNEEFDHSNWHLIAGNCALMNGRYNEAITHFEQALRHIPTRWHSRRVLTLLPLAEAYARKREKEASLEMAQKAASEVHLLSSRMLSERFLEYQGVLSETFPRDRTVSTFIAQAKLVSYHP
ncbi:helix-turn-helix domain-containing protein [Ktedonospora formicarum]|uniref:HTH cro/C1-type domain-containing protein n=1 Tax=Ktedonospora formicarum TaxID=2778364 RepID=A0A8J3MQ65_9CHLR|nr:hypothetical protein [Ktedonospora formicarum]GHO42446.1 hypothetical protein KSX_06090 [Ktedonospora formicarum]